MIYIETTSKPQYAVSHRSLFCLFKIKLSFGGPIQGFDLFQTLEGWKSPILIRKTVLTFYWQFKEDQQ